eukprot:gene9662-9725_t
MSPAQDGMACEQRSRNPQPVKPGEMRGTVPGMLPSGSPRLILPGIGTQASSPCV